MKRAKALVVAVLFLGLFITGADAVQDRPLQIGIAESFFRDIPKVALGFVIADFKEVMKQTTSLDGELTTDPSAMNIASRVSKGELAFGILHAYEFACVQNRYTDLQPLMVASSRAASKAYLVVGKNSPIKSIDDLRGKKFDLPMGTMDHCRVFVQNQCKAQDAEAANKFFGEVRRSVSRSAALDDVARGNAQATVVDAGELDSYKEIRGPVFEAHLRVLQESDAFPPPVIFYKQGAMDEPTIKKFRDGLLRAQEHKQGRELMKEWTIDAFEAVPRNYSDRLHGVLKAYPQLQTEAKVGGR